MDLVKFSSWPALLAYAATGAPLYYQAPLDVRPTALSACTEGRIGSWQYKVTKQPKAIRIKPRRDAGGAFTADQNHLARFLRPAAASDPDTTPVHIVRDDLFDELGRKIARQENAGPNAGWNVREICIRWVALNAIKRGHSPGVCETSLECHRCGQSCTVNVTERVAVGRLAFSECGK